MFLSIKFLRVFFLIFSVVGGILRSRIFAMWFFLELRTVSFLLGLLFIRHKTIFKETIKLFLIQSLRGIRILLILLSSERGMIYSINFFIWLILLFKMRAVPFHSWFLGLRNKISWERVFIFLTIIKFVPLRILFRANRSSSTFFRVASFIVARVRSLYFFRMKKLIILSSLYFLGILFFSINFNSIWLDIILVYMAIFLPLFFIFSNINNVLFSANWLGGLSSFILFVFIIRIAGLPPFPGFFLKYFWLVELKIDFLSLGIFFLSSRLIIYLYISFALKNLLELSNQLLGRGHLIKINLFVFWLSTIPAYISIYLCF